MKLDPGIHIAMHSVLSLKPGVTARCGGCCCSGERSARFAGSAPWTPLCELAADRPPHASRGGLAASDSFLCFFLSMASLFFFAGASATAVSSREASRRRRSRAERRRLRPEMKGRGRRGPEESEDGLFFLPAIGDEAFCLPEPASVLNAYLRMPIPFCNRLLESV